MNDVSEAMVTSVRSTLCTAGFDRDLVTECEWLDYRDFRGRSEAIGVDVRTHRLRSRRHAEITP